MSELSKDREALLLSKMWRLGTADLLRFCSEHGLLRSYTESRAGHWRIISPWGDIDNLAKQQARQRAKGLIQAYMLKNKYAGESVDIYLLDNL